LSQRLQSPRKRRVKHLTVTKDIPDSQSEARIGIDSGLVRITTLSAGRFSIAELSNTFESADSNNSVIFNPQRRKSRNQ